MRVNWKKYSKRIPHRIQAGKKTYFDIKWVDDFSGFSNPLVGLSDHGKSELLIKRNQGPKITVETYIHELLHLFSAEYDIELTESQIMKMEQCFYYLLKKDNIFK